MTRPRKSDGGSWGCLASIIPLYFLSVLAIVIGLAWKFLV